jgi:ribosomal protein S11
MKWEIMTKMQMGYSGEIHSQETLNQKIQIHMKAFGHGAESTLLKIISTSVYIGKIFSRTNESENFL